MQIRMQYLIAGKDQSVISKRGLLICFIRHYNLTTCFIEFKQILRFKIEKMKTVPFG